jgi:hypothetical protein
MIKSSLLLAVAALMPATWVRAQLAPGCPVQPTTLKAMRDCYRPLLVFAPTAKNASFISQQAMLDQYADDMMDRNLLYVPVLAQSGHFQAPLDAPYAMLKPSEMNAIRARFQIGPSEFDVVLVGKDGGEKYRTKKTFSVLKLDEIVDEMPMARREKAARPPNPQ